MPPTAKTLVLTRHDLAPRNLLLDPSGQLWLLDWDYAGFFPRYFEYKSMQNFHTPQDWNWLAQKRWSLFAWIAVGRSEKERRALEVMRWKFTRFRVGQRFNLLRNGNPSRRRAS